MLPQVHFRAAWRLAMARSLSHTDQSTGELAIQGQKGEDGPVCTDS